MSGPNPSPILCAALRTSPDGKYTLRIDLALPAGVTVLVGPSGSGKSTTLDLLAGHRWPDEGEITLGGTPLLRRVSGQPPSMVVPPELRHIGYVMQQPMLFPHLSVRKNLEFGITNLSRQFCRDRIVELAEQLQIGHLLERRPSELSGGQRQRVALGRALAPRPKALLLDEPLSAVDLGQRHELLDRLRTLLGDLSIPVLYVTHSREEQLFWCAPTVELRANPRQPAVVEVAAVDR